MLVPNCKLCIALLALNFLLCFANLLLATFIYCPSFPLKSSQLQCVLSSSLPTDFGIPFSQNFTALAASGMIVVMSSMLISPTASSARDKTRQHSGKMDPTMSVWLHGRE